MSEGSQQQISTPKCIDRVYRWFTPQNCCINITKTELYAARLYRRTVQEPLKNLTTLFLRVFNLQKLVCVVLYLAQFGSHVCKYASGL